MNGSPDKDTTIELGIAPVGPQMPFSNSELHIALTPTRVASIWDDPIQTQLGFLSQRLEQRIAYLEDITNSLSTEQQAECREIEKALAVIQERLDDKEESDNVAALAELFKTQILEQIPSSTPVLVEAYPYNEYVIAEVPDEVADYIKAEVEQVVAESKRIASDSESYEGIELRSQIVNILKKKSDVLSLHAIDQLQEAIDRLNYLGASIISPQLPVRIDSRNKASRELERSIRNNAPLLEIGLISKDVYNLALDYLRTNASIHPERYLEGRAAAQVDKLMSRLAKLSQQAPHLQRQLANTPSLISNIASQADSDFIEYLIERHIDEEIVNWADNLGLPTESVALLRQLNARVKRIEAIVGDVSIFKTCYLNKDAFTHYFQLDETAFRSLIITISRMVQAHTESRIDDEFLAQMPTEIADAYRTDFSDRILTKEEVTVRDGNFDPVVDGRMDAARKRMKEAQESQRDLLETHQLNRIASRRRRVRNVTGIMAMAAGFFAFVLGTGTGLKSQAEHMNEALSNAVNAADSGQSLTEKTDAIYPVQFKTTNETSSDYDAPNPSLLAQQVVEVRHSELSDTHQARLAAASTNTAIMALSKDQAPHVNPAIPAELAIDYLETWTGYYTPILAFNNHLQEENLDQDDLNTGDFITFVKNNPEAGGPGTAMLIDRMLGTVPSLTLDEEQAVEALTSSMDMILKGDVDELAKTKVKKLSEKGYYDLSETDQVDTADEITGSDDYEDLTGFLEPLDEDGFDVNLIMDDASDLPPEPRFVKAFEPETTEVMAEELDDDWFIPEEPIKPVKKSWFSRAKKTVSRWFS